MSAAAEDQKIEESPFHDADSIYEYVPTPVSPEENLDFASLLGMLAGLFALYNHRRLFAWISVLCNLSSYASGGSSFDTKQFVVSSFLSLIAVFLSLQRTWTDEMAAAALPEQ